MTLTGHSVKSFLVVECSGDKLPISIIDAHVELDEKAVVWYNDGLYSMLPKWLVGGLVTCYREEQKLPQLDVKKEARYVRWDATTPLDAKTAKLLFE